MSSLRQTVYSFAAAATILTGAYAAAHASFPPSDQDTVDIALFAEEAGLKLEVLDETTGQHLEVKEGTTDQTDSDLAQSAQSQYREFQERMKEEATSYALMAEALRRNNETSACPATEGVAGYQGTAAFLRTLLALAAFDASKTHPAVAQDNIAGMMELLNAMGNSVLQVTYDAEGSNTLRVTPTGAMGVYSLRLNMPNYGPEDFRQASFIIAEGAKILAEEKKFGKLLAFTLEQQQDESGQNTFTRTNISAKSLFNQVSGCATLTPAP